jgi:hypothetical protein
MADTPNTPNAAIKAAGNQVDNLLKPKITIRIEWVLVIAAVANVIGAIFHV